MSRLNVDSRLGVCAFNNAHRQRDLKFPDLQSCSRGCDKCVCDSDAITSVTKHTHKESHKPSPQKRRRRRKGEGRDEKKKKKKMPSTMIIYYEQQTQDSNDPHDASLYTEVRNMITSGNQICGWYGDNSFIRTNSRASAEKHYTKKQRLHWLRERHRS